MPNEALTPRSDTTSTESSGSPPDRAPSDSSSGVHSGEERDELVIRGRTPSNPPYKPIIKQVAAPIAEEPFGRSTNMRMSSFNNQQQPKHSLSSNSVNNNGYDLMGGVSATLPLLRSGSSLLDYHPLAEAAYQCNTMPAPGSSFNYQPAATAVAYRQQHHQNHLNNNSVNPQVQFVAPQQRTTLPSGVRYNNQFLTRRVPHLKNADSPYGILGLGSGHHTFSKLLHDPLTVMPIPEAEDCCPDTTNYAMISEEELYITDLSGTGNYVHIPPMDNSSHYANNNHNNTHNNNNNNNFNR